MSYPSDLTDDQWDLIEPSFNTSGKRGRKHAADLRTVVVPMLYIAQPGCQLPEAWRARATRSYPPDLALIHAATTLV